MAELNYAGVRVELYKNGDPFNGETEFVDHPDAVSWGTNEFSLEVNSTDVCLAEYRNDVWKSVAMIPRVDAVADDPAETYDELCERKNKRIIELQELIDAAYGIIASVDGGTDNWTTSARRSQHYDWVNNARKFIDKVNAVRSEQPLGSDSSAEPVEWLPEANECRAAAQELLAPLSPGVVSIVNEPSTRLWNTARAEWMKKWAV
jgi:hypothetical protein